MGKNDEICDGSIEECLSCAFRHPFVDVGIMKHCQYNKLRQREGDFKDTADFIIDTVFENYSVIENLETKIEGRYVEELFDDLAEVFGKIEELHEIRNEGFDADIEISELVKENTPLADKLYEVLEDNELI